MSYIDAWPNAFGNRRDQDFRQLDSIYFSVGGLRHCLHTMAHINFRGGMVHNQRLKLSSDYQFIRTTVSADKQSSSSSSKIP